MERWPDFFLAGAPKAGTTALHAALVGVPGIALSRPKEPKYFLCGDQPPPRSQHRGPGDAHSRQEWIWRREEYLRLWDGAPSSALRGESTPFYLFDKAAHRRIAEVNPGDLGATSGQNGTLSNETSQLTKRIDLVLKRSSCGTRVRVREAHLVGDTPFQDAAPRWPSDHAGVVTRFALR